MTTQPARAFAYQLYSDVFVALQQYYSAIADLEDSPKVEGVLGDASASLALALFQMSSKILDDPQDAEQLKVLEKYLVRAVQVGMEAAREDAAS